MAVSGSEAGIRLAKEWAWLTELAEECPGLCVENASKEGSPEQVWTVTVRPECEFIADSVYVGESFTLAVKIGSDFPCRPPIVVFEGTPPRHVHIYSNGMICLEPLYRGWTVRSSVKSVVLSILVMLRCTPPEEKVVDASDAWFSRAYTRDHDPRRLGWGFHGEYSFGGEHTPKPVSDSTVAAAGTAATPRKGGHGADGSGSGGGSIADCGGTGERAGAGGSPASTVGHEDHETFVVGLVAPFLE